MDCRNCCKDISLTSFLPWEFLSCLFLGKELHRIAVFLYNRDFLGGSDIREFACNTGDLGSIAGSGRFLEEEDGYLPLYFCLENSMDRGAWQATVHGVSASDTTGQLSLALSIWKLL